MRLQATREGRTHLAPHSLPQGPRGDARDLRPASVDRGSRGGLERIYREHQGFVRRSLIRLGVPSGLVDDAVHDVFLVVARRLAEFEGKASVRTWLFAIALRMAQSHRRDRARALHNARELQVVELGRGVADDPHSRREAARELGRLLQTLDTEKRAVWLMAELEGMTAVEIAATLQVKLPTVYSRLRLAREKLQSIVRLWSATSEASA